MPSLSCGLLICEVGIALTVLTHRAVVVIRQDEAHKPLPTACLRLINRWQLISQWQLLKYYRWEGQQSQRLWNLIWIQISV